MFDSWLAFLVGYIQIRVKQGDWKRLLNLCKANNIFLQDLTAEIDKLELLFYKTDLKKLLPYFEKCQIEYDVIKETGLKCFVIKYKKRIGFALGFFMFLCVLFCSSGYIWHIEVEGESMYTQEEIVGYIEDQYVPLGTAKKTLNLSTLEKELREYFKSVAWISCEIEGTELIVHMVETLDSPLQYTNYNSCNVVAIKDGIITDMVVKNGTKIKNIGDEVKKGEILISGVVNLCNEYEEVMETSYVDADGDVYALTKYPYKEIIDFNINKKLYTGQRSSCYSIKLFGKTLVFKKGTKIKNADKIQENYTLHVGKHFYLPVSIRQTLYYGYEVEHVCQNEEEIKNIQTEKLNNYLDNLRKKGVEIVKNNVKIEFVNDTCTASGDIIVKELIGVQEEITDIQERNEEPE